MQDLRNLSFKQFQNAITTDGSAYQYAIDTLTAVQDKVIEQKFYTVNISDFVDVEVGRGAFNQQILHNVVYDLAGSFESGFINTGDNVRLDKSDIGIDKVTFPIQNWAKGCRYSYIDVQQCLTALNFDIIEQVVKARKRNWDLGVQQVILCGSTSNTAIKGLANNAEVTADTTVMATKISSMTSAQYATFVATVLAAYAANCNNTVMPNRFFIPMEDYLGLATPVADGYPIVSKLEYLTKAFNEIVSGFGVTDFKILPLAYLNKTQMNQYTGVNKYRYILANKNPDTYYAPIPVDFTMTQFGTYDNFNFQNVAYGQVAGTVVLRPQELIYLDYAG